MSKERDALLRFGDMIDIGDGEGHRCRHDYKIELAEQGITGSHEMAKHIPITNTATLKKYKNTLDELGKSLSSKGVSGGLVMLSPEMAKEFLIDRANSGEALQTCKDFSSELTKIQTMIHNVADKIDALRAFSVSVGGSGDIRELSQDQRRDFIQANHITGDARALRDCGGDPVAAAEKYVNDFIKAYGENSIDERLSSALSVDFGTIQAEYKRDILPNIDPAKEVHGFRNAQKVIDCISGKPSTVAAARLVAEIQFRCGLRVENARECHLNQDGTVSFYSKGHMLHDHFKLPGDLFNRLSAYDKGGGRVVVIADSTYRQAINRAAAKAGEDMKHASSCHSFRHTFAKNMYEGLVSKGASVVEAKAAVSEALFHRRIDVVERYLK